MEHEQVRLVSRPNTLARIATMLLLAVATGACSSGSDSGDAGTPEPTYVMTFVPFVNLRPITAWEFRYNDDARITVDGQPAALDDLHDGEIALIKGSRWYRDGLPSGVSIESIDVRHLVIGPVESVDLDHAQLSVMEQHVSVTGDTIVDDEPVSNGGLTVLQPGDAVAVSGFFTESGQIVATRISRRAPDSAVLLRGSIVASNPAAYRFRVGALDVYYGQADIDPRDFPSGVPKDGDRVLLRSRAAPGHAMLLDATAVAFVPPTLRAEAGAEVELTGAIRIYDDESSEIFDVAGLRVNLDCTIGACESNWQSLEDNALVLVVGKVDADGIIQAHYVALVQDGRFELTAPVEAIETGTQAVISLGFRVQSTMLTQFGDEQVGGARPGSVEDLRVGDVVTASGTYGGMPGLLVASRIMRVPARDPQVVTFSFERADPAVIVLGRSILTRTSTVMDNCGTPIDVRRLFAEPRPDELVIGLRLPATDPLEAARVSIPYPACD